MINIYENENGDIVQDYNDGTEPDILAKSENKKIAKWSVDHVLNMTNALRTVRAHLRSFVGVLERTPEYKDILTEKDETKIENLKETQRIAERMLYILDNKIEYI